MGYTIDQYNGPQEFVHLHCHTIFSTLDGVGTPQQYANECLKNKFPAMAATEHGHMGSVPSMYAEFNKRNIKNIVGCEVYYNDYEILRQRFVARGGKIKAIREKMPILAARIGRNRHLTILAKNAVGYSNLIKLTTYAYKLGFYYKPRIWFDQLCKYKEGLIVLSGCMNGPASHELYLDIQSIYEKKTLFERDDKRDKTATEYIKQFKSVFGDDFFVEVQMPVLPEFYDYKIFELLLKNAEKLNVKAVLTNDAHYLHREDFQLQRLMMAIDQKTTIDDPNMFIVNSDEQFVKSRAELWATFKNNKYSDNISDATFEEICDNTLLVADKCEMFKPNTDSKIPDWSDIEKGTDANARLRLIVMSRLSELGLDKIDRKFVIDGKDVTYKDQTEIELSRFIDKGFASYFLITQDLVKYGKERGWPFGPRGSAGGSLVCYLLGIHSIDPLKWKLSFDRFMSSSRGGYMLKTTME